MIIIMIIKHVLCYYKVVQHHKVRYHANIITKAQHLFGMMMMEDNNIVLHHHTTSSYNNNIIVNNSK